jgi:hypothetical protein
MRFETFAPVPEPISESLDGSMPAHPEDAFLAAICGAVRCSRAERQVLRALVCEALDQADGPEGDFATLDVDAWLRSAAPAARRYDVHARRVRLLALAVLAYLTDACLLDVVTAASLRCELRAPATPVSTTNPALAAAA